jgi:hypothetical protein
MQCHGVQGSAPEFSPILHPQYCDFVKFQIWSWWLENQQICRHKVSLRIPLPVVALHMLWQHSTHEFMGEKFFMKANEIKEKSNDINTSIN